jgi:hypothetical protein
VTGLGTIWTVINRLAFFCSYKFGLTHDSPTTIALFGFGVAL